MFKKFVILVFVAFAVRTADMFAARIWAVPLHGEPSEEVRIAQHVEAGRGFVTPFYNSLKDPLSPSAHSPPAYVYFLAGLIRLGNIFGAGALVPYRAAILINALLGAIAVAFLAAAGANLAGSVGFYFVGYIAALWPTLVTQSLVIWDTGFTVLFLAIGIWLATSPYMRSAHSNRRCLLMGILGGVATLMNPIAAPFLAAVFASRLFRAGSAIRPYLLVAAAWLVCITPWTVRNALVFHRLVPIRHNFGFEVWLGNVPGCDGTEQSAAPHHPLDNPAERRLAIQLGESRYMQLKSQQAIDAIRANPAHFARMTANRIVLYWFGDVRRPTRLFGVTFPMFHEANLVKILANASFLGVALASLLRRGSFAGRFALALGILVLPLPFYITHVGPNYRVFVDPILCVLVGITPLWISERLSAMRSAEQPAALGQR